MNNNLKVIKNPTETEINYIKNELKKYNDKLVGEDNHKTLSLIIRNNKDEIIGGLVGGTYWGWLYIDRFWINEKYRNQGLGKNIIKIAEEEAKMRGCKKAQVDTHDFQAFDFYVKQDYKTICEIKDFPKGHCKYIMIKEL